VRRSHFRCVNPDHVVDVCEMVGNVVGADNVTPYQVSGLFRCDIGVNSRESDPLSTVYERFIHMFKEIMHM